MRSNVMKWFPEAMAMVLTFFLTPFRRRKAPAAKPISKHRLSILRILRAGTELRVCIVLTRALGEIGEEPMYIDPDDLPANPFYLEMQKMMAEGLLYGDEELTRRSFFIGPRPRVLQQVLGLTEKGRELARRVLATETAGAISVDRRA